MKHIDKEVRKKKKTVTTFFGVESKVISGFRAKARATQTDLTGSGKWFHQLE